MKSIIKIPFLLLILTLTPFSEMKAQVTVGGGVNIRIGIPEVVVVKRTPRRRPVPAPRPQPAPRRRPAPRHDHPVIITEPVPAPAPCHCDAPIYGTLINQNNGPRYDYHVVDAYVKTFSNHELDLILHLNTGEVMVISMHEANHHDYNFHYYPRSNRYNNTIRCITLNDAPIALNSASVSLQPRGQNGYTAVLNLHSIYDGDFNGTVTNIN